MTTAIYRVWSEVDPEGTRIIADAAFVAAAYPGHFEFIEAIAAPEPTPAFPTLTRKELRNGLLSVGITSADIEGQINAIADPVEREAAMIDWQDTLNYERTHPLIAEFAEAFSLPPEQVDALWLWAAGR